MRKYLITHINYPGEFIEVVYSKEGRIMNMSFKEMPNLGLAQLNYLQRNIPTILEDDEKQMADLIGATKGKIEITAADFNVSFEVFWDLYGYKRHKKDAEKLYNRLSYADKVTCLMSIKPYHAYRKRKGAWMEQMLPDTYISKREFETDWKTIR